MEGFLLSSRHWLAQPNAPPLQSRSTPQSSAPDPPGRPHPPPAAEPGGASRRPGLPRARRGRTGAHRACSSGRQGSVGEIRAAQVRDHQERVPRVRGALKERAVLGPSHCGQDQGGVRPSAAAGAPGRGTRDPSARARAPGRGGERGRGDPGWPERRLRAPRGPGMGAAGTGTYLRRNSPAASGRRPERAAGASPPAEETQRRGRVSGRRAGVRGVGRRSLLTSESELLLWFSDSLTRDDLTSSRSRCAEALSLLGSCSSPPSSWKGISSSFAPRSSPPPAAPAPEPPPPSWGMVGPRAGATALRAPRRPRPARPGSAPPPPARPAAPLAAAATKFDRAWSGGKRGQRGRAERGRLGSGPSGSAEPRAPQLAATACSAGASQRLARQGGASGAGRRARQAGQGGRREEPGCKLTPAPRGTPPAPARTHSLAFTLAHQPLTPSGGCASPPRAPPSPPDSPRRPTSHPQRPARPRAAGVPPPAPGSP